MTEWKCCYAGCDFVITDEDKDLLKGTVKVGGNFPLKYCISGVLATPLPPFGLKKVTALLMLFISQIVGPHFWIVIS